MKFGQYLLIAIFLSIIFVPVSAVINITPIYTDTSSILWEWNTGLNITTILIDSKEVCGYETLQNNYTLSNLDPGSLHSIYLISTTNDTGYNLASTTTTKTPTDWTMDLAISGFAVGGSALGIIYYSTKRRREQ